MRCAIIVVTRNQSAAVKTLHTLLNLNFFSIQNNIDIEINFVKDDPFEKVKLILKKIKTHSRIVFIEYGLSLDEESMKRSLSPLETGYHGVIFPCVKEEIDWEMFNKKAKSGCKEPIHQMALNFDTEVEKKPITGKDNYKIIKTNPKCWAIETKPIVKNLKGSKGCGISIPAQTGEMFEKFREKGVKLYAFTGAEINTTFQHECLGNILNMYGVTKEIKQ